jgi:hypothetical protein
LLLGRAALLIAVTLSLLLALLLGRLLLRVVLLIAVAASRLSAGAQRQKGAAQDCESELFDHRYLCYDIVV